MAQLWHYRVHVESSSYAAAVAPKAYGKFFHDHEGKFFFKAVALQDWPDQLNLIQRLEAQAALEQLNEDHATGVVVEAAQAGEILALAARVGLRVLVRLRLDEQGLEVMGRSIEGWRSELETIVALRGHPALLGYLLDFQIPPEATCTRARLRETLAKIRTFDEHATFGLRHGAETRIPILPEEDFVYGEYAVGCEQDLEAYVVELHSWAEARPVIVAITGRPTESEAAPTHGYDASVADALAAGAAGVVVPCPDSFTVLRKSWLLEAPSVSPYLSLNGNCPPVAAAAPMVSVVICAYNAERTMRACLESLRHLTYPNYEVIVVDDGSRDETAAIGAEFAEFRLISQPNQGLSAARNVGLRAASGEIVAYTDSDCVVDPDWLTLIVAAMERRAFDGCGGPNYAPHEEGRIESCVAAAPGTPSPVLLSPGRAEHLAGCNMVFRKAALTAVGGFDSQFRTAGDDVDICWRLLHAGLSLGYCPAAFVWHFRRNTARGYYDQQRGYGRAEAMLYAKYPERFNRLGQIRWSGVIPGLARTIPAASWRGLFQRHSTGPDDSPLEPTPGLIAFLPQTVEWHLVAGLALLLSLAFGLRPWLSLGMLALGPLWALYYAMRVRLEKCHDGLRARSLVAFLAFTGPLVRALARYRLRGSARQRLQFMTSPRQRPTVDLLSRQLRLSYWKESYIQRERLLDRLGRLFTRARHPVMVAPQWSDFDLELHPSPWVRLEVKTATEEHENSRVKTHVLVRMRASGLARAALLSSIVFTLGAWAAGLDVPILLGAALFATSAVTTLGEMFESGRLAYRAIEASAAELDLTPLGTAISRARRAPTAVPTLGLPRVAAVERAQVVAD